MSDPVHVLRRRLRDVLAERVAVGTFVKLADPDVVELVAAAGFDFAVVDLEHSTLSPGAAAGLVRHAHACGLPALVRIPAVDGALVNRLLEAGAVGFQLSMLARTEQTSELVACTRFAPAGRRSVSLANRIAGFGRTPLAEFLAAEATDPPVLVGQIETVETDPVRRLVAPLDVCFVGTTDLGVDLGPDAPADALPTAVAALAGHAGAVGTAFGGWAPSVAAADGLGLAGARYLVVGSDLQILAAGLRAAAPVPKEQP
jgi:4-hydroxy-2-oxoheptanedioate aldolase